MSDKLVMTLYVAKQTPRSMRAIANIRRICEHLVAAQEYELNIVDVLEHPEIAEEHRIMATPTLIKEKPQPKRRIIGDLTDTKMVIGGLDLSPQDFSDLPLGET